VLNISDLGADEPIQQNSQHSNKWAQDLDILNEVENSEEQSAAYNSLHSVTQASQSLQTVQSSRNPSINEESLITSLHKQTNSEVFRTAADMLQQVPELHPKQPESLEDSSVPHLELRDEFTSSLHVRSSASSPERNHELCDAQSPSASEKRQSDETSEEV
jgi:hypothetical protein